MLNYPFTAPFGLQEFGPIKSLYHKKFTKPDLIILSQSFREQSRLIASSTDPEAGSDAAVLLFAGLCRAICARSNSSEEHLLSRLVVLLSGILDPHADEVVGQQLQESLREKSDVQLFADDVKSEIEDMLGNDSGFLNSDNDEPGEPKAASDIGLSETTGQDSAVGLADGTAQSGSDGLTATNTAATEAAGLPTPPAPPVAPKLSMLKMPEQDQSAQPGRVKVKSDRELALQAEVANIFENDAQQEARIAVLEKRYRELAKPCAFVLQRLNLAGCLQTMAVCLVGSRH